MNIRDIVLYSYTGEMRRISFKVNGLNIVTGRSSTGKSALSDIVEYCMGRSDFNIPEGPIRDKVSWYAVFYQFAGEQVMIAKPAPALLCSGRSRRGSSPYNVSSKRCFRAHRAAESCFFDFVAKSKAKRTCSSQNC